MRILHLSSEYPPQKVLGLGRFVYDLAGAQAAAGDEVCVVTNSLSGERHDIVERGVRVARVHFPPPPKPSEEATTVMQFNAQLVERAAPIVEKWRPHVINVHDWLTATAGKVLKKVYGTPLVVTVHDTVMGKSFGRLDNERKFIGRVEQWICRYADRAIANSSWVRGELVRTYGVAEDKISTVPCAVDVSAFGVEAEARHVAAFRRVLAAPDEPIALYVGRLDPEKGLEILAEAWAAVVAQMPSAKLVVAGRGKLEKPLGERLAKLGIAERVLFAGYVRPPALALLYHVSAVHVVPSTYEPFGIVALEGMASGRAVVASRTGGLADIVEHDKSGLLVEPGDARQLAEAILGLLRDPTRRERLGKAARERAAETFNWHRVAQMTRQVYESVAREPSRTGGALPAGAKRGPRVLFDCLPIHEGMTGIGTYADSILKELPSAWPEAEWVLMATGRNAGQLERRHGLPMAVCGREFELRFPARQEALSRLMKEVQADVYFSPMFDAPANGQGASVTMIHDLAFLRFPDALPPPLAEYTRLAAEHAARRSQRVVTVSNAVRAEVMERYGLAPERVAVAYPGVDDCLASRPSRTAVGRVLAKYGIDRPYLLAVNLTNPRKNARRLMEAFALLCRGLSAGPMLAVAGGWDLRDSNTWRLAYDAGIDGKVVVTGYVSRTELLSLYAGAEAVCLPSLYEGFGMPVAEAMACRVPVVTSNRGAMAEVAGEAALLVEPEDVDDMAAGLREVLENVAARQARVERGAERAGGLTWKAAAEVVAGALRQAVTAAC